MFIKDLRQCDEFLAGDSTTLRELLHPDKAELAFHYSLAHAVLPVGKSSQPHRLNASEVYYILEGNGRMHINDAIEIVKPEQAIYIPPHAQQFIENIGTTDLKFLCIVDPAWRMEDEEVF